MLIVSSNITIVVEEHYKDYFLPITEEVHKYTGQASTQIENLSESLFQMSGCLQELKYKGKYQSVIHKSVRGHLWERFLTRAFNYKV